MKMTFLTLLLITTGVCAIEAQSQVAKVSITVGQASCREVLSAIERQTDYLFVYEESEINLNKRVTINVRNQTVAEVLRTIFQQTDVVYAMEGNNIMLMKKSDGLNHPSERVQQGTSISGTVMDANGETLPGANVTIKGSTVGVVTNVSGRYSINVPNKAAVLVFSSVGFATQEITVGNRTNIEVNLQEDTQALDEVVVVGYGTQRKVSVVAAITTIEPAKLKTSTTRSLSNNLAGNLGGIIGVQRSGEPGYDNSNFWIRGISTFAGGSTPLVLIDGIERSLNDIDVQEVESLSVLKDASASAVYGVRGSNGVILVTTKRGKVGKPVVKVQVEHAVTAPVQLPEFLNAPDYLTVLNEINMQQYGTYWMEPDKVEKYRTGYDPELYPDVNWMDAITKDFASNTRTTLDINGGSEVLRYSFVAAYYHEDGILERDEAQEWNSDLRLNRFNMRTNVDLNVTKTTLLRFNIGGYLQNRVSPPQSITELFGGYVVGAFTTPPYVHPTRYASGELPRLNGRDNPWARTTQTGYARASSAKIESVFTVEQDITFIPGLKARGIFSFDNYTANSVNRTKEPDYYNPAAGRDPETGALILNIQSYGQEFLGYSKSSDYGNNSTYVEGSFLYDHSFGKHLVNGLLLYNQRSYDNGNYLPYRNQGFAGRAAYTYNQRYVAEFNFGYNGSENFARGQRFGFFPSIAAGWIMSEESFMAPVRNIFSKVKFRASHGLAGNDDLTGKRFKIDEEKRFPYITTIGDTGGYTWGTSDAQYGRSGRREGDIGVTSLTWETVTKTNIGLELELFKCFELQVDVFKEQRRDIFMQRSNFPSSAGFATSPWANFGKVDNQGIETTLILNKQINQDWAISARATATYAVNEILEKDEALGVRGTTRSVMGKPVNQLIGLVAERLFTESDFADLDAHTLNADIPVPKFSGYVNPGDIKYADLDENGVIDALDQTSIGGTTDPQFVYGFAASVNYKNIDFAFMFQGNALTDRVIGRGNDFIPGAQSGVTGNIYTNAWDAWTVENPRQDAFYPRLYIGQNPNNSQSSTWWLKDMSMLRLKNLEIGYSLPRLWAEKVAMKHARIYLRGTNLVCFSKFKLWDPEIDSNNNSGSNYPIMRTLSIGLDVTF